MSMPKVRFSYTSHVCSDTYIVRMEFTVINGELNPFYRTYINGDICIYNVTQEEQFIARETASFYYPKQSYNPLYNQLFCYSNIEETLLLPLQGYMKNIPPLNLKTIKVLLERFTKHCIKINGI